MRAMIRILLAGAACMWLVTPAWASEAAADRLADTLGTYATFQAAFTQTITDEQDRVLQQTQGNLMAKRPGLFYWETLPPANQFIVSNGEKVELYDPDLEQVTIRALNDQAGSTPALLLSGETDGLSESYDISEARYGDHSREYTLVPRSEDSLFVALTLIFYDDELQAMRLEDSLAQTTQLEFGNIRINQPIANGQFELSYPDTVDIIQGLD